MIPISYQSTIQRLKDINFFMRNQKDGEWIDNYVTAVKTAARTRKLENLTDSLIKDGSCVWNPKWNIREMLFCHPKLTMDKCTKICKLSEALKTQIEEIRHEDMSDIIKIYVRSKRNFKKQSWSHKTI